MLKRLSTAEDSEWILRLTIQLFNLSAAAFTDTKRGEQFKTLQWSLVEILRECRDVQLELSAFIEAHDRDTKNGIGVEVASGSLRIEDDIEPKLNRLFKDFFTKARTALYHFYGQKGGHIDEAVTHFLLEQSISFVYVKDDSTFEEKAKHFLAAVPWPRADSLVRMLRSDRSSWIATLVEMRDRMIHDTTCPRLKMSYGFIDGKPQAAFPTVNHFEIRAYIDLFWENLINAVEETVVLCLAMRTSELFVPVRIPDDQVDPKLPFRWRFAMLKES